MALTRRGLLKSGVAAVAATNAPIDVSAAAAPGDASAAPETPDMLRETLLLDFGWRFHLGHACDPAQDFGFGKDLRTFAKAGENVATAADPDFDDAAWRTLDIPHDWAVELPFVPSPSPPPADADDPNADTASGRSAAIIPKTASAGTAAPSPWAKAISASASASNSTACSATRS